LVVAQSNGDKPGVILSAHAPGEHGVSFLQNTLAQGVDAAGICLHHMVFVTWATEGEITTTIEDRSETFSPSVGTTAIIPEGAQCSSHGTGPMAAFVLMVPKETLAFAAAERAQAGAGPIERLKSDDCSLLHLCRGLARQISEGFVDDPLAWYELSNAVVQRLIDAHLSSPPKPIRGRLSPNGLARVIDYIHDNIDRTMEVDDLADVAQQSWSHFPRLFRRSTGLSPYQYVIKVRLETALALLRSSSMSIAQVAAQAGFADQSHLCRWARRAYGAAPSQLLSQFRG
jgi:AraC family transcriptional regulator